MKKVGLLFAFLFIPVLGFSATLNVPGDYATIQGAIDAAAPGDTVLVGPGYYVENIDFVGKAITVISSDGPLVTTIDGKDWTNPDVLSTVVFMNFEGLDSVLEGFTITGGQGTLGAWGDYHGGGIHMTDASPTIQYNIISGNNVEGLYSGGGGIHGYHSDAEVIGNVITANWAAYSGGGFDCTGCLDVTLMNNVIIGNKTGGDYGGTSSGISINATDAVLLLNNLVACNVTAVNPGAPGTPSAAGIGLWNSGFPVLQNCTVVNNYVIGAGGRCGGIQTGYNTFPTITDCVLWGNYAEIGKEIYIYASPADVTIDYCNVEGGLASCFVDGGCNLFWGTNMMDSDPLFATGPDGFFYLGQTAAGQPSDSPCMDAGSDLASALGMDAYWTRTDEVPDAKMVDMGFHYGPFPTPLLMADTAVISCRKGGMANYLLNAGDDNGKREYFLLGSASGTYPGTALPGGMTLPLNWDLFTEALIILANTPVAMDFNGMLDGMGASSAMLNALGQPSPGCSGLTLSFSYIVYYPIDVVSNVANIYLVD